MSDHVKPLHGMLRAAACLTAVALLSSPGTGPWSSVAWGQQSPGSRVQVQAEPRRHLDPRPTPVVQPSIVEPSGPNATSIALYAAHPASRALRSALVSCDKESEDFEPVSLSGTRGPIRLDRCYRGRDHLVCSFKALSSEAKALLENYRNIVDANYPAFGSVDDVCRKTPDNLVTDLQNTVDFAARYKALKAEYDARATCANTIEGLLGDATLPDLPQGPGVLNSMIAAIEGDIKEAVAAQARLVEFADKMSLSQKAILTLQRINRAMCVRSQSGEADAGNRGTAVMPAVLESAGPFISR
jgi:hypothetical protein